MTYLGEDADYIEEFFVNGTDFEILCANQRIYQISLQNQSVSIGVNSFRHKSIVIFQKVKTSWQNKISAKMAGNWYYEKNIRMIQLLVLVMEYELDIHFVHIA